MFSKSKILVFGLVILIGISLIMFFFDADKLSPENPAGKNIYYTQVPSSFEKHNDRYVYEVIAYDNKGKDTNLEFTSSYQLKEGAILRLLHTRLRGVTYWEETSSEQLPADIEF